MASRSLTGRKWILKNKTTITADQLIAQLMQNREIGVTISPSFNDLSDPLQLGQMPKVIERIQKAITGKESVGIIGDYDADGITGTAQLIRFFRRHNIEPQIILPHRQEHGYGIKKEFIDDYHKKGITLLITIDMGITYIDEIKYARSLGMDVIVMDHHEMTDVKPDALILHPQLTAHSPDTRSSSEGCSQLTASPCASGVVFTFIRAFEQNKWDGMNEDVALAAIGTVADVVPLRGENRTIVQLGLRSKGKACFAPTPDPNNPIAVLARSCVREGMPITSGTIGFRIAPRINAAGRIAEATIALDALLNGGQSLEKLTELNKQRQDMTEEHLQIALETIENHSSLLTFHSSLFHPGIVGLTAGKLTERTGKPSCIGAEHNSIIHCSLRSIPEYRIADALQRCSEHLTSHGGHAMAGGCTLHKDNWDAFSGALTHDALQALKEIDLAPRTEIDAVLDPASLTIDIVKELQKLEPFGEGNREPTVLIRNVQLKNLRAVGKEKDHLQCRINGLKSIGFRLGSIIDQLPEKADIVCRLGLDAWNGNEGVQLFVEDVGISSSDE